jgi:DNA topoisomerase-1
MNKKLIIVESPAKCSKIESYLGNEYKCIASYGHLRKLPSIRDIDINNNFETNYTIIDEPIKKKQINIIRKEIENAKEVILATDDDREGEAIAWHICILFDLPISSTKRIVFHEITEKAIKNAVLNPKTLNINLINAQKTRQILDLLVGFTISPILWNSFSKKYKNGLSAGRCQSVALRIIYDNYNEIQNNKSIFLYNTVAYFTNKNIVFELSKEFETEKELLNFYENSLDFNHIFSISSKKLATYNPPLPLVTSTLQQLASNDLHIGPKETMKCAQELYENGLITYMRTDNKKYSKDFVQKVQHFIIQEFNDDKYIYNEINNICMSISEDKAAHEAIRPVHININLKDIETNKSIKISEKSKKLYHLIWKKTLESCMSPCTANYLNAEITASEGIYKHRSEQIIFLGWKIIEEKEIFTNSTYSYLLSLKQGITMEYKKITSTVINKNNILHLTEARLVQLLEDMGIGRPSTYSSLIDKIQERKYVLKENIKGTKIKCKEFSLEENELSEIIVEKEFGNEKNKLVIQPLGILVIEFLIKNFNSLFNYEYTKNMENELDIIADGKKQHTELCKQCYEEINVLIKDIDLKKYEQKCEIKIDDTHSYIIGKNGPVIKEVINNCIQFKTVKKDIDLKKLEQGDYELTDLLDSSSLKEKKLGKYQGTTLYLKKGKYGLYVEWGTNKKSMKDFGNRPIENIDYVDVVKILEKDNLLDINKPVGLLRQVNENISIRCGKYGNYIFYKNNKMKSPAFYKLTNFKGDCINCDKNILIEWIKDTYHIF